MNNYPAKYESCRTNELRRVAFTKYIMKLHENVKVPYILQKSWNQNGGII